MRRTTLTTSRHALAMRAALLSMLAALLVAGCGPAYGVPPTTPPPAPVVAAPPPAPRAGALVVRNGTVDPLALRVDGADVAELAPGATRRVEGLAEGRHDVLVWNEAVGVLQARGVDVPGGHEVRWHVRQRFGALVVRNETRRPATIVVGGDAIGTVQPGAEGRFRAVPEGRRDVEARGPAGAVLASDVLVFEEGATRSWAVLPPRQAPPPPPATLDVHNATDVAVTVYRDGYAVGTVPPEASGRFQPLAPGEARLVARDARGDVLASAVIDLRPGAVAAWRVAVASCRLRVENQSAERYLVVVDGRHLGPVERGRAHVYAGLRPGGHRVEARPVEGGVSRTRDVVCPPGGAVEWVLTPPPRATLEVHNGTDAPLDISLDGQRLGTVGAGFTTRFHNLAPGTHRIEASGRGIAPHVRDLEFGAGGVHGWTIGPRPAALLVRNGWDVPAIVVLDGRRIGRVPPRDAARFEDLVAGSHTVRAEREDGPAQVAGLRLPEGRTTDWAIQPDAPATLRIVNRNAVPVDLRVGGRDHGTLAPGAERVIAGLRAGVVEVEARAPSGAVDAERIELRAGAVIIWMARLPDHAALTVVNDSRTDVAVQLGARRLGLVRAGARETFRGLAPGRHAVRATGPGGAPLVAEATLSLTTGAVTSWIVRDLPGASLRVRNLGHERVVVFLGGHRLGPVPAGGEVLFQQLAPGRTVLLARGLDGRDIARDDVVLHAGGLATVWTVRPAPATGDVVIENHAGFPIRVLRGRDVVGEIAPGARTVFELPRGDHELRAYDTAPRPALVDTATVRVGARAFVWKVRKPGKRLPVPAR